MAELKDVKGIGPKSLFLLEKMGITTIDDLVMHYPFRYELLKRGNLEETKDGEQIIIDGKVLHKDISFPPNVGLVIENMTLLPGYNAFDNLKLLADIKKIATDSDIKNALERVGLHSNLKVKKFSLGMKQRLNIAQAIFEKQNIILLDEPTNALDSDGVQLIYDIIREEKKRGAVVIIATHHEEDLKELCDTILTVSEGKVHEKQTSD